MSLRNLLWFYRLRLRARFAQELFALVGIAVGVALLFAVQVSSKSLNASIAQLSEQMVGDAQFQVAARGPRGFSEAVMDDVRRLDGVEAAAAGLYAQANAVGPDGARAVMLLAATPELARLRGEWLIRFSDKQLAGFRAVALPSSVADALGIGFGSDMRLQINGVTRRVPVGGIVGPSDVGQLAESPVVVAPLRYGQALAGMPGRISRIYVRAEPGRADEVEQALERVAAGRLDVRPAGSDGRVFSQAATPSDQTAALFAGISAFVGFVFAFNAMLLMARERRGVIADLRMAGYGARAVIQVLLFDAIVLGVVASVVGLAVGDQLSRHLFHPSPGYLAIAFPVGSARTVGWDTVVLALVSGTLAAVLAMLPPLLSAARAPSLDAVEDDTLDERYGRRSATLWRSLASIGCLALTTLVLIAFPEAAVFGMATLVLAMLFALPAILKAALGVLDRVRRRVRGVAPAIAMGELMSAGSRSVAIAAVAAIAVFSNTAIEGARQDLERGLEPIFEDLNGVTDLWVAPAGRANTLATAPFQGAAAKARLARVSEVESVEAYRGSFLDIGDRRVWVIAPPRDVATPIPPSQVLAGAADGAERRVRRGGWIALSEAVAAQLGVQVGDRFTLPAPKPTSFRVAAITTNLGWSPGAIIANADDYRSAWDASAISALHVGLREGVPVEAGRRAVRDALGEASGLVVETPDERSARHRATTRQGLARLGQIATLVLIAAALAMAAATGGMVWQRRRRLADLKLAGINYRELWKAVLLESALLLAIGCAVGAVFGLYGQQLLDRALESVTGFPVDASLGLLVALMSLAFITAIASVVALIPGWLAARVPADFALRD